MIRADFSQSYYAKKARVARLPKLYAKSAEAGARYMAEELVRNFHDGIVNDTLGLEPLRPRTVSRKDALGYDEPGTPLYGMGDSESERSYANMMRIARKGTKFVVRPSKALHWSKKVPLSVMFRVHEYGATITDGFGMGTLIRITPRPAFRYAYAKLMRRLERRDPASEVRVAARKFVRDGDEAAFREIERRSTGEYSEG
jgi:hypothetical protein